MPGVNVRFTFNTQEFRRMQESGSIAQGTERAAGRVRDWAKENITQDGRVDTGRMRASIQRQRLRSRTGGVFYEVGTPVDYARYQHDGTRDHGPRRARLLRFTPKGSSVVVFAKRVRGVKPSYFLTRALQRLRPTDFYS